MKTIDSLMNTLPQVGSVEWLGVRTVRRDPMSIVDRIAVNASVGIVGDRYSGRSGARHVTLIQWEHLAVVSSVTGQASVSPELLRRNIVVRGVNLLAFKGKSMKIGSATLEITGLCHPCSRMEEMLGPGGYNAMRGHSGITARVLTSGYIAMGDSVEHDPAAPTTAIEPHQ